MPRTKKYTAIVRVMEAHQQDFNLGSASRKRTQTTGGGGIILSDTMRIRKKWGGVFTEKEKTRVTTEKHKGKEERKNV